MNATQRRNSFKTWLVNEDGKAVGTANSYASGVTKIQERYRSETKDMLNFFTCSVDDIPKLEAILEDYLVGGKYEHIFWDNGTARNGLKKYIEYLRGYHFKRPQVILHKNPANVDITRMLDDNTLQALFLQQFEKIFPGYTQSKIAQREGVIFLENKSERHVLGIMLDRKGKGVEQLFFEMSTHVSQLQELCEKEKMSFQGMIIAGKDKKKKLEEACKNIPAILVKTYTLDLHLTD